MSDRDATEFGLNISKDDAAQMEAAAAESQRRRDVEKEESLRIANDAEISLMEQAAKESQDKRDKS